MGMAYMLVAPSRMLLIDGLVVLVTPPSPRPTLSFSAAVVVQDNYAFVAMTVRYCEIL